MMTHLATMNDHRVIFKQDPAKVILDISALKNGSYLVDGQFSAKSWAHICTALCLPLAGEGHVKIRVSKDPGALQITGEIYTSLLRECVRTGESFLHVESVPVAEQMPIEYDANQHTLDIEAPDVLDVGAFVLEQLHLGLDPYPVHPKTLVTPRGQFGLMDGFDSMRIGDFEEGATGTDDAHPFSALQRLRR